MRLGTVCMGWLFAAIYPIIQLQVGLLFWSIARSYGSWLGKVIGYRRYFRIESMV